MVDPTVTLSANSPCVEFDTLRRLFIGEDARPEATQLFVQIGSNNGPIIHFTTYLPLGENDLAVRFSGRVVQTGDYFESVWTGPAMQESVPRRFEVGEAAVFYVAQCGFAGGDPQRPLVQLRFLQMQEPPPFRP